MTDSGALNADRLARENPFKLALQRRELKVGFWSALTSHLVAEIIGDAGFDWVLFDCEHAPNDLASLTCQLQALRGSSTISVARPLANQPVHIKGLLDIGFRNLLIPFVQTPEEAEMAVAATRYPPEGVRGVSAFHRNNAYGRDRDYFRWANQVVGVIVQVETGDAIARLEAISAVPGLDAIFVGPGDLAASLGHLGDVMHPQVQEAIRHIGEKVRDIGLSAGVVAGTPADVERYLGWGYNFMTVSNDIRVFNTGMAELVSAIDKLRALAR